MARPLTHDEDAWARDCENAQRSYDRARTDCDLPKSLRERIASQSRALMLDLAAAVEMMRAKESRSRKKSA